MYLSDIFLDPIKGLEAPIVHSYAYSPFALVHEIDSYSSPLRFCQCLHDAHYMYTAYLFYRLHLLTSARHQTCSRRTMYWMYIHACTCIGPVMIYDVMWLSRTISH